MCEQARWLLLRGMRVIQLSLSLSLSRSPCVCVCVGLCCRTCLSWLTSPRRQILHVLTASLEHAQLMLSCGVQAGFRESGAVNLVADSQQDQAAPMVAIRSMGLGFESLIGVEDADGRRRCTVSNEYLRSLVLIANERFDENSRRIRRFHDGLARAFSQPTEKVNRDGIVWEDAAARRERKRAEGLRRQAELQSRDDNNIPPPPS